MPDMNIASTLIPTTKTPFPVPFQCPIQIGSVQNLDTSNPVVEV